MLVRDLRIPALCRNVCHSALLLALAATPAGAATAADAVRGASTGVAPPARATTGAAARALPPAVRAALARAQVPADAMTVLVQEAGSDAPWLAWQAQRPVNPASLFKLVTTYAALDLLGPAYRWRTPVWLDGAVQGGVLDGALVIRGQGDPSLVVERVWLLLRRVRQMGVREIRGDIVLDRGAFAADDGAAADFDGEALRPYNVRADALLLAYRSVVYRFTPDTAHGVAHVSAEPALHGVRVDAEVPLAAGPCNDWHAALEATPANALRMQFAGSYPAACGERGWALAYADPASFDARLLRTLWRELGGTLGGTVRDGVAPAAAPSFEVESPALAEVVRDINKFSNNVMAQQVFLTLGLARHGSGSAAGASAVLREWLEQQLGARAATVAIVNGSGLARDGRISAEALAALLQSAWRSPVMPELMSSLPVSGLDGTLRNSTQATGRAHLKTGSLRDVVGVAGYLLTAGGRRLVLVAVVNHPNASRARPALDALLDWALTAPAPRRVERRR